MLRICLLLVLLLGATGSAVALDFKGRARFSDGDTLRVGLKKVRLFGIDAPEKEQNCQADDGSIWACGIWATDLARSLFDGQRIACEQIDVDRYDRRVSRCFLNGQDIAETLVQKGAATAYRRYSMQYIDAEKIAAIGDLGVWSGQVLDPAKYRAAVRKSANNAQAPENCPIKGNISKSGQIYHLPGQKFYDGTSISLAKGERWFCTEAEARAAGWRKAKQ